MTWEGRQVRSVSLSPFIVRVRHFPGRALGNNIMGETRYQVVRVISFPSDYLLKQCWLVLVSIICPRMKQWESLELVWLCPCSSSSSIQYTGSISDSQASSCLTLRCWVRELCIVTPQSVSQSVLLEILEILHDTWGHVESKTNLASKQCFV